MDQIPHQPVTKSLVRLIKRSPEIGTLLSQAIEQANIEGVTTLEEFYTYTDLLVTKIPDNSQRMTNQAMGIYFVSDQIQALKKNKEYEQWLTSVADAWGQFLDTPASIMDLDRYIDDPGYNIQDYMRAPSGWCSFNQFFARQVKPGKRPIDSIGNDDVVVSPADSIFMAVSDINEDSEIVSKGVKLKIANLLKDSSYANSFADGTFTHSFLNTNDYHRFHVPVSGTIEHIEHIPGEVQIEFEKDATGKILPKPTLTEGYLFTQDRGLVVIDSPLGLVAVLPIGMAQISSVQLTPEVGAKLYKGQEFGYFQFGGSDIITLFQADRVKLTAQIGEHYNQGEKIGHAVP